MKEPIQTTTAGMSERTWEPLFGESESSRAHAVLRAITDDYRQRVARHRAGGSALATDDCVGAALMFDHLERAFPGRYDARAADECLDLAIEAIAERDHEPRLLGGFVEVAWAVEFLAHRRPPVRDGDDDGLADIDEALAGFVAQSPWGGHLDLVAGLAGIGVYALERLPRRRARDILAAIVDRLFELAVHDGHGISWLTPTHLMSPLHRDAAPDGYVNLGVAHGVPGIVTMLAACVAAGVAAERAGELLDGAVRWLDAHRLPDYAASVYEAYHVPGAQRRSCRLGWCYGDAGMAAALDAAGRLSGRTQLSATAAVLARKAAARRGADSGVEDALLCHGSAGLGHLFHRLWHRTGDPATRQAAVHWYERTLTVFETEGLDGFRTVVLGRRETGTGLLTGSCGVALALAAAVAPVAPRWDRILLMSPPLPTGGEGRRP